MLTIHTTNADHAHDDCYYKYSVAVIVVVCVVSFLLLLLLLRLLIIMMMTIFGLYGSDTSC